MDVFLRQEINEWKSKYPFLKQIWELFQDFSNELIHDENELYIVCDDIANGYPGKINEYKKFCKILLKNLGKASVSKNESESETKTEYPEDYMNHNALCTNLNIWLYYYTKKHHVPDDFIKEVFSAKDGLVTPLGNSIKYTKCNYVSYSDVYAEPDDLLKLLIFVDNKDVIENKLNERSSEYNLCVNYINECARIYRNLKTRHCNVTKPSDIKYIMLCKELETFKTSYTLFYNQLLKGKKPYLDFPQLEDGAAESKISHVQASKNEHTLLLSSSLKSKITTVTAGVGTCAFLGILYKFTPARGWFSALNKATKPSILLDDGQNEMVYYSPDSLNMELDNTGYNIGYHSMENY